MGFASDVERWAEKTRKKLEDAPRRIVHDLAYIAVHHTPVDTGTLRANWTIRVNEATAPFKEAARDEDGGSILSMIDAILATVRLGDVVYLLNPTPYFVYVEFGTDRAIAQPMLAPARVAYNSIVTAALRGGNAGAR
jgi:hypothetical protein